MKNLKHLTAIAAIFLLCAVLSSCNGALDRKKCLKNIKRCFPDAKIYAKSSDSFIFYVVDSTGVREVTTLNLSNADIDGIKELEEVK